MHVIVLAIVAAVSLQAQAPAVNVADAYNQFMLARHLEATDDVDGAIEAYKKAMAFDPTSADIPAELAALYMKQGKAQDALKTAEQALKVSPSNREAHRVAGLIYASMGEARRAPSAAATPAPNGAREDDNFAKAIEHLAAATRAPDAETDAEIDPNVRATLARLYITTAQYAKAIPLLSNLVRQEPGWSDGPGLLAEAYAGAGRDTEAIQWLEQDSRDDPSLLPTLAEFYERAHRWKDAADAYSKALLAEPGNPDLSMRYASALLNAGGRDESALARQVLTQFLAARPNDPRATYLKSQAERRLGDLAAAEKTSRGLIAANARSPWGYFALAETLEERRQYQAVIDALAPAVERFRAAGAGGRGFELTLLLPHLGFAYQQIGQLDKALAVFEEAHKLAPSDPTVTSYYIEANLAAKKYAEAAALARAALADHPDDLRLTRLEAQALRQQGKADQAIALAEQLARSRSDDPEAVVALAQIYLDAGRGDQAVKVLQAAESRFPENQSISFELGAVFDKQKKFADAEAAFRQVIAREPDNAPALNYLGYMLAEHGQRLAESEGYIKKALEIEPDNGSYLDSLGWAYFKDDKLDLAETNLKRAAEQLVNNSVIQDHYGDVLFKRGRYDQAIDAWTRALAGDGEAIDRGAIDRKIKSAKSKLPKR